MSVRAALISTALGLTMAGSTAFAQPAPDAAAQAQADERQRMQDATPDTPGTGRYPAIKEIDRGLPDQVVYRPADLAALGDTKLGVYAFGNGACTDDGASARLHLLEVASHGYLAIAPGAIYNGPGSTERPSPAASPDPAARLAATRAEQLREAIDWALAENARASSPYFGRIDPAAVAVSGFSCGGLQALAVAGDARVATAVIMNSGVFNEGPTRMGGMEATKALLDDLHFPTLYILGGPTDIAYENGMDDFERIDHVPVAVANIDTGHGGTYWEPNGGAAAEIVVDWLDWQLRGSAEAGRTFVGKDCGLCTDPAWTFESKRLDEAAPASHVSAREHDPERLGLSSERLERVAQLMQRRIDEQTFSGAVTLIARDGEIAYFRAQGVMDLDTQQPMRRDAVFRIMSMTKPIVALSILMMVEEGKVRLTDPVSRFIPALRELAVAAPAGSVDTSAPSGTAAASASAPQTVPAEREITVRDLLTHTSGLMSGGASSAFDVSIGAGESLADVLPRLADVPLDFQPGTRWAYSGQFGFDVLVRVVEVASGMPFDAFAQQRIFDPLGMTDTFFHPVGEPPRLATLYRTEKGELVKTPDLPFVNGTYFSGGGGLFSTAEDYLKFALLLQNGGRLDDQRLVSRRTVDLMKSVFVPDTLPGRTPGEGYGLGVRVVTDSAARNTLLSEGSFGWSGAFNTHFFIDPRERLVGIFMTQSAFLESRQQLREDFETAVMQALMD